MNTFPAIRTALGHLASAVLTALKLTALVLVAAFMLLIWIVVTVSRQIFYSTYPR